MVHAFFKSGALGMSFSLFFPFSPDWPQPVMIKPMAAATNNIVRFNGALRTDGFAWVMICDEATVS